MTNPYSYVSNFPKDFQIVDGMGYLTPAWQYFLQALWAKTGGGSVSIQNSYVVVQSPSGPVIMGPGPSNGAAILADAPSDGTLYGRKNDAWSHVTHLDITDWVANQYVLPTASMTVLGGVKIDGTTITIAGGVIAASGSLPLTGGVLTGDLGLPTSHFPIPATVVASGATTVNRVNGEYQRISLTANSTIAVTGWPATGNWGRLVLEIDNTGAFGITGWPTGTVWPGGTVPTITSGSGAKDVIVLMSGDGGASVFGSVAGQNYH